MNIPTTEEVREAAATDGFVHRISYEEFDAWLEEVKDRAWDIGRNYRYDDD